MNRRIRISKETARHLEDFGTPGSTSESMDRVLLERTIIPRGAAPRAAGASAAAGQMSAPGDLVIASRTDIGHVRKSNQDALILAGRLVGVADGMGGHNGGEVASAAVRDSLVQQLQALDPDPKQLVKAMKMANRRVFVRAQADPSLRGMGTTTDALWFGPRFLHIAHVGDSRVYRLQNGRLEQITEDHSMVMEMFRSGMLTRAQADVHPMRNIITRAMGTDSTVDVDLITVGRRKGDLWLACSDGLHGMIDDRTIEAILAQHPPEQAAELLLNAALNAGGRDNVSLVIVLDKEGAHHE